MASAAQGGGKAPDAAVETAEGGQIEPSAQQRYLEQVADQSEAAVEAIEAKIAGMQETLKTAKADAKTARAAARRGA
jgi:hypothetical protein